MEDADVFIEDLQETIQFDLEEIIDDDAMESIGGLCESVQNDYRTLAILQLTSELNVKAYFENLVRSSFMRYYYLRRCEKENYKSNPRIMSSRNEPFLNALAANQFELSKKIALLTSDYWWSEDEYEDDFCYSHFLHVFVQFETEKYTHLETLIERYEASLADNVGSRLAIMQSLLAKNKEKFVCAFDQLIEERVLEIEVEGETGLSVEMQWEMDSIVFIEGLALLNIATRLGLDVSGEFLFCPVIVRNMRQLKLPKDGYLSP